MQPKIYFENIKDVIQTELQKAQDQVLIAVAWFTDDELFEDLVNLSRKGIRIQLLINDDKINKNSGLEYPILFRNGGMVYFVNSRDVLMHNKFCIIDKQTVLNGSFNWTRKASSNLENLTVIKDKATCEKFITQFKSLKECAIPYFEQIDTDHPEYVNNTNDESLSYGELLKRYLKKKENGNYLASLLDLKQAIKIKPEKKQKLLFDIAYCQSKLDDNGNAITNYTKYIEYNPNSSASFNNRGLLYEKLNRIRLSYLDFSEAIKLEPKKALYYNNRANLDEYFINDYDYLSNNKLDIHNSDRINSWGDLGFWMEFNLKKMMNQCVTDYLTVIELDGDFDKGRIYSSIAELYFHLSKYGKSIEFDTKAIRTRTDYDYGYYRRSLSNYNKYNYEDAMYDIERALEIKPDDKVYDNFLKKNKKTKKEP